MNKEKYISILKSYKDCKKCNLCVTRTKMAMGKGNPKPIVMFIGIGPGYDEDLSGLPFTGPAGRCLHQLINIYGIDSNICGFTNIVACRPYTMYNGIKKDRDPTEEEANACSARLQALLRLSNPSVIVLLGKYAATRILDLDLPESSIKMADLVDVYFSDKWKCLINKPIYITYHPSYIIRNIGRDTSIENLKRYIRDSLPFAHTTWLTLSHVIKKEKEIRDLL